MSSLAAPQVVVMTTCGATSDGEVGIMTTLCFPCDAGVTGWDYLNINSSHIAALIWHLRVLVGTCPCKILNLKVPVPNVYVQHHNLFVTVITVPEVVLTPVGARPSPDSTLAWLFKEVSLTIEYFEFVVADDIGQNTDEITRKFAALRDISSKPEQIMSACHKLYMSHAFTSK